MLAKLRSRNLTLSAIPKFHLSVFDVNQENEEVG